jgi:hypothetical protein
MFKIHNVKSHKSFSTSKNKPDLHEKLKILKDHNFNFNNNEYKYMLEKGMAHYYRIKWINNRKKYLFYFIGSVCAFCVLNLVKYYYVIYYYIMWDIDIRKPRVSDYIIDRFR